MIIKRKLVKKKRNSLFKKNKDKILKYYYKGYPLGTISRCTYLDISTILDILSKCKIRKKQLYETYEKQMIINEVYFSDFFIDTDKPRIDRFFPNPENEKFTLPYFLYWKKNNIILNEKRKECKHIFKNICCATCGEILQDATNIILDKDNVTTI